MTTPDDPQDTLQDDSAPGWDAITAAFAPLYPDQEPRHYGTLVRWMMGGQDPLDGISAWKRLDPVPHWHFVGYGLSELYDKASDDPAFSGYGLELTFRLACDPAETEPPAWALNLLQNLARYVYQSGNVFEDGHWMNLNGPIALGTDTLIGSLAFVFDPEVPPIETPHGRVAFIQVVGLTVDEEAAGKRWNARKMLDIFLPHMPLWITDVSRASLLDQPEIRAALDAGSARDGSSTGMLFNDALGWTRQSRLLRADLTTITIGAGHVENIVALLRLRLPFGNPLRLLVRRNAS
ncbi:suppressor of fused domain protein [Sphingomonas sp. So64.6b]|uniref:suppressor of fused domain protein n=1 Tax=Sphingomonas sp. So64.6b TaxID=2997354 RepID=UPI001920E715|nr:suppressor of fused domain protein [Sphingomonas sp. So64.6b]